MAEQQKPVFAKRSHKPVTVNDAQRLAAVLRSQGIARTAAIASLPSSVKAELGKLCNRDGALVADARQKAEAILDAYYDGLKATVDHTPTAAQAPTPSEVE